MKSEIDQIIQSSTLLYVTMPAKAGGQSLKEFTRKCMKYDDGANMKTNLNHNTDENKRELLTKTYEIPSLITGHINEGHQFVKLIEGVSDNTILIYVHRQETNRLVSAINQVVNDRLCRGDVRMMGEFKDKIIRNESKCIIDEKVLVDLIAERQFEIGDGIDKSLTCAAFDAIEKSKPNMLIINYRQVNQLQEAIAKQHCPDVLSHLPIHINDSAKDEFETHVQLLSEEGKAVLLSDWLERKKESLEWTLDLKDSDRCQRKIRDMERILFTCQDEIVRLI